MGLETQLEFETYCKVVESPKTGLNTHPLGSKIGERDAKGKPTSRSYLLRSLDEDFSEISFGNSCSSSCKSISSRPAGVAGEDLKRGSIYQSSKVVRRMKKVRQFDEGRKNELSPSSDTSFSFRTDDSWSRSNKVSSLVERKGSPLISLNSEPDAISFSTTCIEPDSQDFLDRSCHPSPTSAVRSGDVSSADRFFGICPDSEEREHCPSKTELRGSMEELSFRCDQTICPVNTGNGLLARETDLTLRKSFSAKVGMPYSPCPSENSHFKSSPKSRFTSFRRMLDPIMKSKFQRSQSVSRAEFGDVTTVDWANIRRSRTLSKSLLHDFSNTVQRTGVDTWFVEKNPSSSVVALSPAHLHGLLKLTYKDGAPFFEFSLKDPEDNLVAKTWKAGNAFNLVYTFHSLNNRGKGNSSGWGAKERHKESSVVGQMQVSCYLCSEMRSGGTFDNSMVTEFVLYDIAHARKSLAAQQSCQCSPDSVIHPKGTECLVMSPSLKLNDQVKHKLQLPHASSNVDCDASIAYPWAPADLHPNLEIAAIVIQVPFEKKESLNDRRGNKVSGKINPNLINYSMVEQRSDIPGSIKPAKVNVVTPIGTHGLPSTEEGGGPSPLLDRWRSGGGCNCGGWDMACPLIVFGNPIVQKVDHPFIKDQRPLELFVQGSKEKMPVLTITILDEEQYSVEFHAQLSKLQAFSICVAVLHSAEISTAVGQERRSRQLLRCDSLKVLLEEEVRLLIDAVEDKRNLKRIEEMPPSFVLNPTFSPIARM